MLRTAIPSFLVTLGTFFILRRLNIAATKGVTSNVSTKDMSSIQGFSSVQKVFASQFTIAGVAIRIRLLRWILFVVVTTWVPLRTHFGKWIFAVGGSSPNSPGGGRAGPTARRWGSFMAVGFLCWFIGMHILFAFNTVQSGILSGNEFITSSRRWSAGAFTGGYGSAIGRDRGVHLRHRPAGHRLGRLEPRLAMLRPGALLLGAIPLNNWVRKRVETMR